MVDDNRQLKVTKTVIEKDGKPAQAVVFTNRYQKAAQEPQKPDQNPPKPDQDPKKPKSDPQKPSTPKTGDATMSGLYIGMAVLSLGGLACVLTYKKRNNR